MVMKEDYNYVVFSTFSNNVPDFNIEDTEECIRLIKQSNQDHVVSIDAHPLTVIELQFECKEVDRIKNRLPFGLIPHNGIPIYSDDTLIPGKFRLKYESGRVETV